MSKPVSIFISHSSTAVDHRASEAITRWVRSYQARQRIKLFMVQSPSLDHQVVFRIPVCRWRFGTRNTLSFFINTTAFRWLRGVESLFQWFGSKCTDQLPTIIERFCEDSLACAEGHFMNRPSIEHRRLKSLCEDLNAFARLKDSESNERFNLITKHLAARYLSEYVKEESKHDCFDCLALSLAANF